MPCLLKQRTPRSPGIIVFTHNEVLNGVAAKSEKVRAFLKKSAAEKEWIYGVHIQGDCSHLPEWPRQKWESFFMWPKPDDAFISNIPPKDITPITCLNFLPQPQEHDRGKSWDICVISRPSKIKRITETLLVIKQLFALKEDLKVVFIVPDPRKLALGDKTYKIQDIDRNYFDLPRKIFSCKQLKQISFISSSQPAFGTFPVSDEFMGDILARSRFLLLTSYREGGPRVIAEAFTHGTPCIVSNKLLCGLDEQLNQNNTLYIDDDIEMAAGQMADALKNYSRFSVDQIAMQRLFCETWYKPALREYLTEKIQAIGENVEGNWYLEELDFRLASHGRKHNMQFMNDDRLFFDWIEKVYRCNDAEPDEDYFFGSEPLVDKRPMSLAEAREYLKRQVFHPVLRRLRASPTVRWMRSLLHP